MALSGLAVVPVLASGGAKFSPTSAKIIRFIRKGCANRPFYHLVVIEDKKEHYEQCIEQLGSFDPLPNARNEKLVALNLERIRYWIGEGAIVSSRTKQILGLSGFLPIHPITYTLAWRARQAAQQPEPSTPPTKVTWRDRKKRHIQEAGQRAKSTTADAQPESVE